MWFAVISTIILGSVIVAYVEYMRQELIRQSNDVVEQRVSQYDSHNRSQLKKMADEVNQNDTSLQASNSQLAALVAQSEKRLAASISDQRTKLVTMPQMLDAINESQGIINSQWKPATSNNTAMIVALSNAFVPVAATTSANTAAIRSNNDSLISLITQLQQNLPQRSAFQGPTSSDNLGIGPAASAETVAAMKARMPLGTGMLASADSVRAISTRLPEGTGPVASADRVSALTARMPTGSGLLATAEQVNSIQSVVAGINSSTAAALANIPVPPAGTWTPLAAFTSFSNLSEGRHAAYGAQLASLKTDLTGLATSTRAGMDAAAAKVGQMSAQVASMSARIPTPGTAATGHQLMSFSNTVQYVQGALPRADSYASVAQYTSLSNAIRDTRASIPPPGTYAEQGQFFSLSNYVKTIPTGPSTAPTTTALNITQGSGTLRTTDNGDGIVMSSGSVRKSIGLSSSDTANYGGAGGMVGIKLVGAPDAGKGKILFLNEGAVGLTYTGGRLGIAKAAPAYSLDVEGTGIQSTGVKVASVGASANSGTVAPESITPVSSKAGNQWISTAMGLSDYENVVIAGNMGRYGNDVATIGAHNKAFGKWSDLVINPDDGNVGVGLRAPGKKLDVKGGIRASTEVCVDDVCMDKARFKRVAQGGAVGRYVRLYGNDGARRYLNINQIDVWDANDVLVSRGKPVAASSVLSNDYHHFNPAYLTNGNYTSRAGGRWDLPHTNADVNPWFRIDLQADVPIKRIEVINRDDCCGDRVINCWIGIFNTAGTEVWRQQLTGHRSVYTFTM